MAVTMETGGRIFVDPVSNLVIKIVNKYDESAYRYADTYNKKLSCCCDSRSYCERSGVGPITIQQTVV